MREGYGHSSAGAQRAKVSGSLELEVQGWWATWHRCWEPNTEPLNGIAHALNYWVTFPTPCKLSTHTFFVRSKKHWKEERNNQEGVSRQRGENPGVRAEIWPGRGETLWTQYESEISFFIDRTINDCKLVNGLNEFKKSRANRKQT